MVLFILINVLIFESVDKILWCCHSNDTSSEVFHMELFSVQSTLSKMDTLGPVLSVHLREMSIL